MSALAVKAVEADPAIDTAAIAQKMSALIVKIVMASGDPNHAALSMPSSDHSADEVIQIAGHAGVTLTAGEVDDYRPVLAKAKEIAASQLKGMTKAAKSAQAAVKQEADRIAAAKAVANAEVEQPKTVEEIAEAPAEKPKAAKKTKAKKEPAAAKEPKPKAAKEPKPKVAKPKAEIVRAPFVEVVAASHQLPEKAERAKLVPLPEFFYLEGAEGTGKHQVDPTRRQGYAPVMPNLDLLKSTGNPYPHGFCKDTVKTTARFEIFPMISHYVWQELQEKGELRSRSQELAKAICEKMEIKQTSAITGCIGDTLRDLALYGLCVQYLEGSTRIFRNEKPE